MFWLPPKIILFGIISAICLLSCSKREDVALFIFSVEEIVDLPGGLSPFRTYSRTFEADHRLKVLLDDLELSIDDVAVKPRRCDLYVLSNGGNWRFADRSSLSLGFAASSLTTLFSADGPRKSTTQQWTLIPWEVDIKEASRADSYEMTLRVTPAQISPSSLSVRVVAEFSVIDNRMDAI